MRIQKNKGFIPLDILVVTQVIMTLALSSLSSARGKAQDAYFQSSASSVMASAILCCDEGKHLNNTPGKTVCDSSSDSTNYPDKYIANITIQKDCDRNGNFSIKMTPAQDGSSRKIKSATCTAARCDFEK